MCFISFNLVRVVNISWIQTFTVFRTLYVFFWVIPRRLNLYADVSEHSVCFFLIGWKFSSYRTVYEDGTYSISKWHIKFRRRGITQKKTYNNSKYLFKWNLYWIPNRQILLWYLILNFFSESRKWFVAIAFQLCFGMCH